MSEILLIPSQLSVGHVRLRESGGGGDAADGGRRVRAVLFDFGLLLLEVSPHRGKSESTDIEINLSTCTTSIKYAIDLDSVKKV